MRDLEDSLLEDLGVGGDITTNYLVDEATEVEFAIVAKEMGVFVGVEVIDYFLHCHAVASYELLAKDGELIDAQRVIAKGIGQAKSILKVERVMLNYIQHLSGVASLTAKYVDAVRRVNGGRVKICDTRKTLPGLRKWQKYAVLCAGGSNHRFSLDSSILVKDNHIALFGSLKGALELLKRRAPHFAKIEVECETLEQTREAVDVGIDIIMLDNMPLDMMKQAVELINKRAIIEVSGGVSLDNVAQIASLDVDYISIGKITNCAMAMDISMEFYKVEQVARKF
ncbi:Nicotinate-nucleotide diphosphorylase [Rickettsiales endosymbiont of Paramecium tredecaurelia]|uniref:carboxylating nicotinate-nucleotide diphosphorylase n=1 Tax=Candidatus Sarmatiella mevalonica TaxID=2770581 RepID=UPI001924D3CA|nr:carboxylating nicotinate-nucleotide diphosphorylase [Candidatus Sarmatiella mevalonica]MBL3285074.1 Nicotinate-nucleotide diphosphorylase [Candidatus Sarmatiella mevalonica]